jgi:uncharacterized repeat protein (TIGR04076 family)
MEYRVIARVEKVKGHCPVYIVGDRMVFEDFYLCSSSSANVCMHALASMSSLLSPFLHGSSAIRLGIGLREDTGYVQCPDPGEPYTQGGTVIFKLIRKPIPGK